MDNRHRSLSLFTALILLTPLAARAEPPIAVDPALTDAAVLRYQFPVGEIATYRIEVDQRLTIGGEDLGEPTVSAMRLEMDTEQQVSALDETGNGTVEQRIASAVVNLTVGDQNIPATDLANQLTGLTLAVQMSPTGAVLDVLTAEAHDQQLDQLLSLLEDSVRRSAIEFPNDAVAVGDSWSRDVPVSLDQEGMDLEMGVRANYTFLGYAPLGETRAAVIQSDLTIRLSGTFEDMGLSSSASGNGQGTGYTYFDNGTGQIQRSSLELALETNIEAEGIELAQTVEMLMNITKL